MYRKRKKRLTPYQHQQLIKQHDKGTVQLQQKRKSSLTTEPLDLCFKKGLITKEQYDAGCFFRHLFSLKHGRPHLQAYDPFLMGRHIVKKQDELWVRRKQKHYDLLMKQLHQRKLQKIIVNTCIYCIWPSFLQMHKTHPSLSHKQSLDRLIEGLDLIESV